MKKSTIRDACAIALIPISLAITFLSMPDPWDWTNTTSFIIGAILSVISILLTVLDGMELPLVTYHWQTREEIIPQELNDYRKVASLTYILSAIILTVVLMIYFSNDAAKGKELPLKMIAFPVFAIVFGIIGHFKIYKTDA